MKVHQEVGITPQVVGALDTREGEALAYPYGEPSAHKDAGHKVGKLRFITSVWRNFQEEVNQNSVTLNPVPPQITELLIIAVAKQRRDHLGHLTKVLLVPLGVPDKQLSEGCWLLWSKTPPLLTFCFEKPAIHVEAEHAIEHVHTLADSVWT